MRGSRQTGTRIILVVAAVSLIAVAAGAVEVAPTAGGGSPTPTAAGPGAALKSHGLAMHGDLKYPPGFAHFDYADPKALKGGKIKHSAIGTFDSFNAFIIKGSPAVGVGNLYDTLLTPAADEPFSEYGLLAESVEVPADRSWVTFHLRPEARWHDGRPITVDDVIWTFETLREKGHPFYRAYYANVEKVERVGERGVRFRFVPGENRELPLILGQLTVLPKHWWEGRDFTATTLDPPLGSGPYRLSSFEPGRRVSYQRVNDYWGRDLPVNVGRHNFDEIEYDYYRDGTVALEAFKAGEYDFRLENSSKSWATAYDFPAVENGLVRREEIRHNRPAGMQAFAFNTRRPAFQDARVRRALGEAFDFEWSNEKLFHGQYTRTRSFFDNSELAATGLPSRAELAVLEPLRAQLPAEVFTQAYQPPSTAAPGNLRANLKTAVELLREAGYAVDPKTKKLVHTATGEPMRFEFLLVDPEFERIVLPFKQNLERLGVETSVRVVDTAQYRRRLDDFDFDVTIASWPQSLSPGNEQREFWASAFADRPGSRNVVGIRSPAIDALIEAVIAAPDRASLVERVHALDRALQWGHWVIPQWHIPYDRVASWDRFGRPSLVPAQGFQMDTWWIDPEKDRALATRRPSAKPAPEPTAR
jgi:microcin C transport system substrate-binding protein